jgi:hypothetical protein
MVPTWQRLLECYYPPVFTTFWALCPYVQYLLKIVAEYPRHSAECGQRSAPRRVPCGTDTLTRRLIWITVRSSLRSLGNRRSPATDVQYALQMAVLMGKHSAHRDRHGHSVRSNHVYATAAESSRILGSAPQPCGIPRLQDKNKVYFKLLRFFSYTRTLHFGDAKQRTPHIPRSSTATSFLQGWH